MRQAEVDGSGRGITGTGDALRAKLTARLTFSRYALHRFNHDGCFAASSALSYMSLVSLVPLGVIALGILSIFPTFASVRQQLVEFVFRNFVPQITEQAVWLGLFYEIDPALVNNKVRNVGGRGMLATQSWNAVRWDVD